MCVCVCARTSACIARCVALAADTVSAFACTPGSFSTVGTFRVHPHIQRTLLRLLSRPSAHKHTRTHVRQVVTVKCVRIFMSPCARFAFGVCFAGAGEFVEAGTHTPTHRHTHTHTHRVGGEKRVWIYCRAEGCCAHSRVSMSTICV